MSAEAPDGRRFWCGIHHDVYRRRPAADQLADNGSHHVQTPGDPKLLHTFSYGDGITN